MESLLKKHKKLFVKVSYSFTQMNEVLRDSCMNEKANLASYIYSHKTLKCPNSASCHQECVYHRAQRITLNKNVLNETRYP